MGSTLSVSCRFTPDRDRFTCNYNSTGDRVIRLTAFTFCADLPAVAEQVRIALAAEYGAHFTTGASGASFTIESDQDFTITWTHNALRDYLGGTGAGESSTARVVSLTSPAVIVTSTAIQQATPSTVYVTKTLERRGSVFLAKAYQFKFTVRALASEMPTLRGVLGEALKGIPLQVRQTTDSGAWSWANPDGQFTGILKSGNYSESWQAAPVQLLADIPLEVDLIE